MNNVIFLLSTVTLWLGAFFFIAGSIGLVRFPDLPSRLHAITKADTVGLLFIVIGLSMRVGHWNSSLIMFIIALLVILSSTVSCQLMARYHQQHIQPGQRHDG
jgi:multicomponent Na+:H+ antiporter subunit G